MIWPSCERGLQSSMLMLEIARSNRMPKAASSTLSISGSFFFQAEDGIRDHCVTGVQTCALPISCGSPRFQVHWLGHLKPGRPAWRASRTTWCSWAANAVGARGAMREYLAWEIDLFNPMATDDDQRFRDRKSVV